MRTPGTVTFLATSMILFVLIFDSCSTGTGPPNILFIITDDQGYGDLGLHGNPVLETPHLDALGLAGTRLDNFHVSPVCAPTRAAVLTGRRAMSTGAYWVTRGGETMAGEEYTMAEWMHDNGYATACIGKWHNGAHHPSHPLSQGFDEFYGFTGGHINSYFNPQLEHNGRMVRDSGYIADLFTDRAIRFIRDNRQRPFFCFLAYNTPHSPFQVPDPYFDRYKDLVTESDSSLRIMNACVYGMVSNIDDNVGRLMRTLVELDLEENTLVVFMTDNGPNTWRYNGGMKGKKAWVNDGGVRVPCFLRWTGHLPEGKVVRETAAHIDLLPTLAAITGLGFQPPREIHGTDLSPLILGNGPEPERMIFTHVNHGRDVKAAPGAVRTPDWRLTFTGTDRPELTRRTDTVEKRNLLADFPAVADSLAAAYEAWFEPFLRLRIPAIPVGTCDSVILPAHEGTCTGNASYYWSENGWSNDWVTSLDGKNATVYWEVEVSERVTYDCFIRYTSPSGEGLLTIDLPGKKLQVAMPQFIPVREVNHSRIDRADEALGQSWARIHAGIIRPEPGEGRVTVSASRPDIEVLDVTLRKRF